MDEFELAEQGRFDRKNPRAQAQCEVNRLARALAKENAPSWDDGIRVHQIARALLAALEKLDVGA